MNSMQTIKIIKQMTTVFTLFIGLSLNAYNKTTAHAQTETSTHPTPKKKIVFIGDSLTAGYGLSPEHAFPAQIQKKLDDQFPSQFEVQNMGISGSTSQSAPSRVQWAVQLKPEWIVLALGANDGLRGLSPTEMEKNLNQAIQIAKTNQIQVLLCGMKVPLNMGAQYRKKYESVFPRLAKKHQLPFIPFLLLRVAGNSKLNQADGIHPNDKGNEIVSETVWKVLAPELKKNIRK